MNIRSNIQIIKLLQEKEILMRIFFHIIAGAITIVFCSILFYYNAEIANAQINSAFFALQGIMGVCACIAVAASCLSKERFILNQTDYWIGAVVLLGTIQQLPHTTPDIAKVILLGVAYFTLRIVYNRTEQTMKIAGTALLLMGLVESWLGFQQLYGFAASNHAIYRLTGSFFNPGPYSGFLITILPIALYWTLKNYPEVQTFSFRRLPQIVRSPEQIATHLLFVIAILCFSGIIMLLPASMSRSAWIAGTAGCAIVLARYYGLPNLLRKYYDAHRRRFLAYATVLLLLVSMAGTGMYIMKKDSADGRLLMWKVSLSAIKKCPWTGVGAGFFPGAYGQAQAEYFASGQGSQQEEFVSGSPEYGFNEYLQIGVEYGIIGLLLFLGIVVSALWRAANSRIEGSNAIIGSITAMLIFALFSYPFQVLPLCIVLIILLAMTGNEQKKKEHPRCKQNAWATRIFALSLLGLTCWIIRDKKEQQEAYAEWAQEKTYFNMNIFEETVDHYRDLYPKLKEEAVFLFEYGQCLAKTGQYEESNRILKEGVLRSADPMFYNIMGKNHQALQQYTEAETMFRQALNMVPHRLYPYYLMAKMYFENGQASKGIEVARTLIAKEPKVMSEAVKEMKKEMAEAIENEEQKQKTNKP